MELKSRVKIKTMPTFSGGVWQVKSGRDMIEITALEANLFRLTNNDEKLDELEMDGWRLKDEGAAQIGTALKKNTHLRRLSVVLNEMSEAGVDYLTEGISQRKVVQDLDMKGNPFGDAGALILGMRLYGKPGIGGHQACGIVSLDLSYCKIGTAGATALGSGLAEGLGQTLKKLNLEHNKIWDAGGMALAHGLRTNAVLEELNLASCNVGDGTAVALGETLSGKRLDGQGRVNENRTLKVLDLRFNGAIKATGATALRQAVSRSLVMQVCRVCRIHVCRTARVCCVPSSTCIVLPCFNPATKEPEPRDLSRHACSRYSSPCGDRWDHSTTMPGREDA